jgi:hypothetical protein
MASRSHLQIVTRPAKPKGIDAPVTYRKRGRDSVWRRFY